MSILTIIVVVLLLGLLVTIHELGHFFAAKILKIKVYELSIFVGPKLLSWKKKDIDYSIRALPFGAYVRFTDVDENGELIDGNNPELLINQKRLYRILVAIAGPLMNLILGILTFTILFSVSPFSSTRLTLSPSDATQMYEHLDVVSEGDTIVKINGHRMFTYLDIGFELQDGTFDTKELSLTLRNENNELYDITLTPEIYQRPMIGIIYNSEVNTKYNGFEIVEVSEDQNDGNPILKPGDFITKINGISLADDEFAFDKIEINEGNVLSITYFRNGEEFTEDCSVNLVSSPNARGVYLETIKVNSFGSFMEAFKTASLMPVTVANISIKSLGRVFEGQEEVYNVVAGPVGVTSVVSDVVDNVDYDISTKIQDIAYLLGIISIGLVFTNMLPIPGLDGVQIILLIIEMIIGKKLSKKAENTINAIGILLLLGLTIFAFASDIIRIIMEK